MLVHGLRTRDFPLIYALMLKVSLIAVGDFPRGPFMDLGIDFKKRLGKFMDFQEISVKNDEKLRQAIPTGATIIVLEATGKAFSSEQFATRIGKAIDMGEKLVFILGGPHGVPDDIKKEAHLLLSLSPMTTTHDLAHLFFLEQLYRACTIVKGITYHY